jgi:diguanylate cyclase (GGDEF)-like protein
MITPEECAQLARNALFRDVSLESIRSILEDCVVSTVHGGEKLLEIGQQNNSLYLVLEGELHVFLDPRDLSEHVALGAGACAGELSLTDGGNVSALVLAARDTRVVALPHHHVWAMVDSSNGIARNLLCILAGRIRNDNLLRVTGHERSLEFDTASNIDALTGLHNRTWMDGTFPRMLLRCGRSHNPVCLLIADIDDFRHFNHAHGHAAGDVALRSVARTLAENLRPQDLLVYLGVDKFAVLLPSTDPDTALRVAERLRPAVAELASAEPDADITISVGIAEMHAGEDMDSLLSRAHMALYRAKAGTARVEVE